MKRIRVYATWSLIFAICWSGALLSTIAIWTGR